MNAPELFLLGRKLMQLAEDALPNQRVGTTIRLVLMDVAYHPDTSISEITERTGFLQSHVSASVAKLREQGVVTTEIDPLDRRRTLVRITPLAIERGRQTGRFSVEGLLIAVLGAKGGVEEVMAALDLIAERLIPEALAEFRSRPATAPTSGAGKENADVR